MQLILRGCPRNQRVKNFRAHAVLSFVDLHLVDRLAKNRTGGKSVVRDDLDELFFGHAPRFFLAGYPNSFDLCVIYTKLENAAAVRAQRELGCIKHSWAAAKAWTEKNRVRSFIQ